jgi:hypothetical protein
MANEEEELKFSVLEKSRMFTIDNWIEGKPHKDGFVLCCGNLDSLLVLFLSEMIFFPAKLLHIASPNTIQTPLHPAKKKYVFENLISLHTSTGDKDTDFRKENSYYCKLVSSLVVLCLTDEHTISSDPLMPISAMSELLAKSLETRTKNHCRRNCRCITKWLCVHKQFQKAAVFKFGNSEMRQYSEGGEERESTCCHHKLGIHRASWPQDQTMVTNRLLTRLYIDGIQWTLDLCKLCTWEQSSSAISTTHLSWSIQTCDNFIRSATNAFMTHYYLFCHESLD